MATIHQIIGKYTSSNFFFPTFNSDEMSEEDRMKLQKYNSLRWISVCTFLVLVLSIYLINNFISK